MTRAYDLVSVELSFPVSGDALSVDYGYLLCAGVKRCLEDLGRTDDVRQLLADKTVGLRLVARHGLANRVELAHGSTLRIRLNPALIPNFLALSGQQVRVGREIFRVGVPSVHSLVPAADLYARFVTIKGFQTPDEFLAAARKQVADLELNDSIEIDLARQQRGLRNGEPLRRVLRIRDKAVVGFAVDARCASADASFRLQTEGVGGRRHFGAGIFVPKPSGDGRQTG